MHNLTGKIEQIVYFIQIRKVSFYWIRELLHIINFGSWIKAKKPLTQRKKTLFWINRVLICKKSAFWQNYLFEIILETSKKNTQKLFPKYYEGGMSYLTFTNVAEYIFPCWVNKMFPVLRMFFGMRGCCDWSKEIN